MFSVDVNRLKTFSTLYHKPFTEHNAMVQSNEYARISASRSDMSEMRLVIKPKANRIWMSFVFALDLLAAQSVQIK